MSSTENSGWGLGMTHEQVLEHVEAKSRQRWDRDPIEPRPTRALVTIVHNEPFFLPIWLDYYSRFFASDDIYVLDHDSNDGSTDIGGFHRIPVSHEGVDHKWMLDTVTNLQHELQHRYDTVLVCDVDEIMAPDPRLGDLGAYLDRFDDPFIASVGFEVLHDPTTEPAFDPDRGVMEQRGTWFASSAYNKPVLGTEPLEWISGFHGLADARFNMDPNLYLIHLHRLDYAQCKRRHHLRRNLTWAEDDLARNYAVHNLVHEGDEFDRWFATEKNGLDDTPMTTEPIPDFWRDAF